MATLSEPGLDSCGLRAGPALSLRAGSPRRGAGGRGCRAGLRLVALSRLTSTAGSCRQKQAPRTWIDGCS